MLEKEKTFTLHSSRIQILMLSALLFFTYYFAIINFSYLSVIVMLVSGYIATSLILNKNSIKKITFSLQKNAFTYTLQQTEIPCFITEINSLDPLGIMIKFKTSQGHSSYVFIFSDMVSEEDWWKLHLITSNYTSHTDE